MRIRSSDRIAGFPVLRVRTALGRVCDAHSWAPEALQFYLKAPETRIRPLIDELRALGYIERAEDSPERGWRVTQDGLRFTNATAGRPIKRKTADRLIRDLLTRVDEVNWNPHYLYRVKRVVVFGSYLSQVQTLGDIDLAVSLEPKESDKDKRRAKENARIQQAAEEGRSFSNYLEQLYWPQHEALLKLKSKSRSIKIHSDTNGVLRRTKTKVIYQYSDRIP